MTADTVRRPSGRIVKSLPIACWAFKKIGERLKWVQVRDANDVYEWEELGETLKIHQRVKGMFALEWN